MQPTGTARIKFKSKLNDMGKDAELRHGLSAVVQIGNTLWVANDEATTLERLTLRGQDNDGIYRYGGHKQFPLNKYLTLPFDPSENEKDAEIDIEGLDYKDGYLWLVGSHSLKRSNPNEESIQDNFKDLARVKHDANRYLLARIPVVNEDDIYTLAQQADHNDQPRRAARLRGNETGNALIEALAQDKHLKPFLDIPGKDNGFDIEGLAVGDEGRVFLGLRGPVLRGWAVILEFHIETDRENATELRLRPINPENPSSLTGNPTYRKHFLNLGGLGIRELCRESDDLLILAGPTMALDAPMVIYRWPDGVHQQGESLMRSDVLQQVGVLPKGQDVEPGQDNAEGIALFAPEDGHAQSVLVVYDAASENRLQGKNKVLADVFDLYGTLP